MNILFCSIFEFFFKSLNDVILNVIADLDIKCATGNYSVRCFN